MEYITVIIRDKKIFAERRLNAHKPKNCRNRGLISQAMQILGFSHYGYIQLHFE